MKFQVYNKKTGEKVEAKEIWQTTPPCIYWPCRAWFYVDEFGDLEILADFYGLNECQAVDMDLYEVRFPEHETLKAELEKAKKKITICLGMVNNEISSN